MSFPEFPETRSRSASDANALPSTSKNQPSRLLSTTSKVAGYASVALGIALLALIAYYGAQGGIPNLTNHAVVLGSVGGGWALSTAIYGIAGVHSNREEDSDGADDTSKIYSNTIDIHDPNALL